MKLTTCILIFVLIFISTHSNLCTAGIADQKKQAVRFYDSGKLELAIKQLKSITGNTASPSYYSWLNIAIIEFERNNPKSANEALIKAKSVRKIPDAYLEACRKIINNTWLKSTPLIDAKKIKNSAPLEVLLIWQLTYYNEKLSGRTSGFKEALDLLKQYTPKETVREAKVLAKEALYCITKDEREKSTELFLRSNRLLERLNLGKSALYIKNVESLFYYADPDAGKIYSEELARYENDPYLMGHKEIKVAVNFYKARYFKDMNDRFQSYYLLKEAYDLSKQDGNIIRYLAFVCRELKKFDEAIYYYNKLKKFDRLESFIGLGECAKENGNAVKSYYYAHLMAKEATTSNTDLSSYLRLIKFFYNIKHYELVEKLNPEILKKIIRENPKSKTLSMIYNNAGIYCWDQGKYDKALEKFQLAILSVLPLELRKDIYADLNYNQCISYPELIRCLNNKGEAFYQRSKTQKDKLSEINDLKQCLKNLNLSVEQINKYKMQLSTEDQMFLYSDLTSVKYPNIIKVCLELFNLTGDFYYHQQALKYAEQGRASIMLSLLRSNNGSKVGLIPDRYKNLEDSINNQIALINQKLSAIKEGSQTKYKLNTQLDILSGKRTELEKVYKNKYPAFYSLKYSSEVIGARQFQSTLSNDECVIEFLLNRNFLISFYIDRKTLLIHTDTLRKIDLAQLAEKFYKRVSQFNPDQFKRDSIKHFALEGLKLYNILLKPFEEKIKGKKLIIVADNSLRKIPFEALLTTSPRDFNGYRDLPYLINRNPVYYAPSITFLNELRQRPLVKKRAKLLAIAPVYSSLKLNDTIARQLYAERSDTSVFGSLPNAQKEIDYANLIAGGRYLKEKEASESKFKELAGKFDIIHIATHGILNTEASLQSSLLFADSYPHDDGLLYNYEIYNLEQSSQLVILSACNTGAGRNYGGEGVISTGRGFLSSGSRSVIMTLWPVNDQASFELIKGFYDGLKDKLTICEALRTSKITYLKKADNMHCHPFFWTGYVIYGDASISLSIRNNDRIFFLIPGMILLIVGGWIIWRMKKTKRTF